MLKPKKILIQIYSQNPDELVKFYTDVMELEISKRYELSDDYGCKLDLTDTTALWIAKHSEVKGKRKEYFRNIISIYVDSVNEWFEKLKDRVSVVQKPELTPPSREQLTQDKNYVFTFLDPENNCLQLVGKF